MNPWPPERKISQYGIVNLLSRELSKQTFRAFSRFQLTTPKVISTVPKYKSYVLTCHPILCFRQERFFLPYSYFKVEKMLLILFIGRGFSIECLK